MKNDMNYEDAMERLNEIVEKLGNGKITLKEATDLYEEGIGLIKYCSSLLKDTSKKIAVLKKDLEGNLELEDIEDEDIRNLEEDENEEDTLF
jgi:exodeoxyribonuclease VII small subunit